MVVILALTWLWNCAEDWRSNFDGLTERFHVFAATNREPSDFPKKKHNMDLTVNVVRRHI